MSREGRCLIALLTAWASLAACTPSAPPARGPAPPATAAAPDGPPPIPEYIPSPKALGQWVTLLPRHPGDDGGVLVDGARVTLGGTLAPDGGGDALVAGQRIPAGWGGGFLFWGLQALYHAPTFLGELEPLSPIPTQVKTVSYGPGFVLVRTTEGERIALHGKARTPGPPAPSGLVDVAALPSGPAVALLEDGRVTLSMDQGASWKEVRDLGAAPSALSVIDDDVWLVLEGGGARRLERDGTWSAARTAPQGSPKLDPGPCGPEFPPSTLLTAAFRLGLPIHLDVAIAPVDGALVRIDVKNGHCLSEPRRIAPSRSRCELVATANGALAVCAMAPRGAIVFSGILDDEGVPKQEASFEGNVTFGEAAGHLLADGPCAGSERTEGVVCLRGDDGRWVELDRRDDRWGGWLPRWIPSDAGGAVGFALDPEPAWIDASTGTRTVLKDMNPDALRSLLARRTQDVVDRQWHLSSDGVVHGWGSQGHVTLRAERGIEASPFVLATMAAFGSRAFGFDPMGHAWQTLDDGATWTEVLAPPSRNPQSPPRPLACSLVGCELQGWQRIGWRTTPPEPRAVPPSREPLPLSAPERPKLSCRRTGSARFLSLPEVEPTRTEQTTLGFGARTVVESRGDVIYSLADFDLATGPYHGSGSELGLRAFTHQREVSPQQPMPPALARSVWFSAPFDPAMSIRTARFALRDIAASAPGGTESDAWLEASEGGAALPVLGVNAGTTAGWVLKAAGTMPLLWVGWDASANGRSYALGQEDAQRDPVSVAARGADELLALVRDDTCTPSVLALGPRSARRLFSLASRPRDAGCPPNRDVLAIGPDGAVAVIRTPSGGTPSTGKDPALLLAPGQPMVPLAPWSTLLPASAEACKRDHAGFRAILMTDASWLAVSDAGVDVQAPAGMMAMLRWSTERVCLEAVEVDGDAWDPAQQSVQTSIVARFDDRPVAGRIAVTRGSELRLPMECRLSAQ